MNKTSRTIPIAIATVLAALPLPASALAEYLVPEGNSAVTQYTEGFPTGGGEKKAGGSDGKKATPAQTIGAKNAKKLEDHSPEGAEVAEVAAETAPEAVVPSESSSNSGGQEGNGKSHAQKQQGGDGKKPAKDKRQNDAKQDEAESAAPPPTSGGDGPSGSSGLGEVLAAATGSLERRRRPAAAAGDPRRARLGPRLLPAPAQAVRARGDGASRDPVATRIRPARAGSAASCSPCPRRRCSRSPPRDPCQRPALRDRRHQPRHQRPARLRSHPRRRRPLRPPPALLGRHARPTSSPQDWNPANPDDPAYDWAASDEAVRQRDRRRADPGAAGRRRAAVGAALPDARASSPAAICDPNPADLRAFATAAAARYSGRTAGAAAVQYWQGLNEPNLSLFFFPQFETSGKPLSPFLYRDLINAFYAGGQGGRTDRPGAAGRPRADRSPAVHDRADEVRPRAALHEAAAKKPKPTKESCGGGVHFDIFAIQPYTTGGPTHEGGRNDVQIGDLPKLQNADRRRRPRRPHRSGQFKKTAALDHRVLLGLEAARPGRAADEDRDPLGRRGAAHRLERRGRELLLVQPARRRAPRRQALQRDPASRASTSAAPTLEQDQPKAFLLRLPLPLRRLPGRQGLTLLGPDRRSGRGGKVKIQLLQTASGSSVGDHPSRQVRDLPGQAQDRYGRDQKGAARARYRQAALAAFSMKPVRDFHHPPFG